jgi:hypothetical protein
MQAEQKQKQQQEQMQKQLELSEEDAKIVEEEIKGLSCRGQQQRYPAFGNLYQSTTSCDQNYI